MLGNLCGRIADFKIRAEDRKLGGMLKMAELKFRTEKSSTFAPFPPSHVLLEIITKCNLRCQWCLQSEKEYMEKLNAKMALEDILKLLPQLSGVKVLMLYGLGEPLLHKELEIIIGEARKYVPCVCFTTNGTLLSEKRSKSLASAGLSRIHVSLDSLNHDFVKKVTGGADIDKILNNLEIFSRTTNIPVRIWSVVCRENIEYLHELVALKKRAPSLEFFHLQMATGSELLDKHNYSATIDSEQMKAFKKKVKSHCKENGILTDVGLLPDRPAPVPLRGICSAPWTGTMMINVNGFITPCCILRTNQLANVFEIGFKKAMNHQNFRAFRKNILAGKYIPDCKNWCGYESTC